MKPLSRHHPLHPSAPARKATVRFEPRPTLTSLAARIEAARLTALRARQWAAAETPGSDFQKRLLAQAEIWEAKVADLNRRLRVNPGETLTLQ